MSIERASDDENLDRRQFLQGISALAASAAVNALPSDLVSTAEAQEIRQEEKYEKQEPRIPSVEEIDNIVRAGVKEKEAVEFIESKIFGGGNTLAGVQAFEFTDGIDINLRLLINRGKAFKRDTKVLDDLHAKALTLRGVATEAHIQFMGQIPEYYFILGGSSRVNTTMNAARLRKEALTLARANDALVALRDEIRKVMK